MKTITPLGDKVIGQMIEPMGAERTTAGGLVLTEQTIGEDAIRPRWFLVTHVGPDQNDINPGDYVLVPHGRWSRGIDIEGTRREEDKLFLLDNDELLGVSDVNPID